MKRPCPGCGAVESRPLGEVVHMRTCARAFGRANRVSGTVEIKREALTGPRSVATVRGQSEREGQIRRAIRAVCPRIPFGLLSGVASQCVQYDLELEAKGESQS